MNNLLNEEINHIQYLFGYRKGVVISEQTELGSAPEQLFTYINGRKELSADFLSGEGNDGKWVGPDVKQWCKDNVTEGSVCVLGKSINTNLVNDKLRLSIETAKKDGFSVEKIKPQSIGSFEEDSGDGTKQVKYYYGTVYSKS